MIEAHLIVGNRHRLASDVAMDELDAAIHKAADHRRMRDDEDGVSGGVKLPQQVQNNLLVGLVEISRGLVGENQFRLIDQRARDRHALLLAAGKFRGQMRKAVSQAHALQDAAACASSVMLWKYCASMTFSSAVRYGTKWNCWKMKPIVSER